MRSDWQSHCLVITVWWTSIVFRLVETEACWASARSTNANLFHVDIISHCLLSNHNTCLTFFPLFFFLHNGNVLPGSLFYFGSQAGGERRGDSGEIIRVMLDVEVYSSNTVLEWCGRLVFYFLYKKREKAGSRNCSDSPIKVILSEFLWAWPDMSDCIPHCSTHHQSCTMRQIISAGGDVKSSNSRGRQ